jgi:hypothetical protein
MSGTTTISQSGNLAGLVTLQTSGSYVIEGNGVTVTTGPLLAIPAFDAFTVENGANLELGTGVVPGLFDTFTIASGGTLDVGSNLNLASDISFAPNSSGGDLVLAPGVSPLLLSTVNGFGGGDSIDVQGAGAPLSPTSFTEFFTGLDTEFIVTLANGLPEVFALPGNLTSQPLKLAPDNAGGFTFTDTACFAAGTAILTTEGEVLVEHLAPGDITVLADGATAEIKFIGRRHIDLRRHPRPETVRPIRIQPGALGGGLPARQLVLSPDHALFIDNVLVQAKDLIDNATIFQDNAVTEIEYFHVELPTHAILLAEGTPAESYLDTGNRGIFENGGEPILLHPDLMQTRREAESIAPLCKAGPTLTALRAQLQSRTKKFGLAPLETLALSARAAGPHFGSHAITPVLNASREAIFAIPRGATELLITTPVFTPADFDPASTDRRKLGLAISAIIINGESLTPESLATSGLHKRASNDHHAWTTGALRLKLPAGTQRLTLQIAARPQNWHFNPKAA